MKAPPAGYDPEEPIPEQLRSQRVSRKTLLYVRDEEEGERLDMEAM